MKSFLESGSEETAYFIKNQQTKLTCSGPCVGHVGKDMGLHRRQDHRFDLENGLDGRVEDFLGGEGGTGRQDDGEIKYISDGGLAAGIPRENRSEDRDIVEGGGELEPEAEGTHDLTLQRIIVISRIWQVGHREEVLRGKLALHLTLLIELPYGRLTLMARLSAVTARGTIMSSAGSLCRKVQSR